MKFLLFLFCGVFLSMGHLDAALAAPPTVAETTAATPTAIIVDRADLEAHLGRKLTFKERIAFGIVKRKARRQEKRAQNNGVTDGLGVASFVIGLGSILLLTAAGLGFLTAIVGLVLGIVSLGRINRNPEFRTGKGFAIAGIAINGGVIFLALLFFAFVVSAFN